MTALATMALFCALPLFTACGDDDGDDENASEPCEVLAAELDTALAKTFAAESRAGGTVAAVITPGCGLWEGAVGDASDAVELTPEHLLRVGSVTKTFAAAAILSLAEDGALALDDTIEPWAPSVPDADKITIRQLLNHTSGIYNYTDDVPFMTSALENPTVSYAPQELVDVALAQEPLFEPGAAWAYSNTNYILLGMIIEAVTGNPAAAEIRNRVIEPQSLSNIVMMGDEAASGTLANGYGPNGEDHTYALDPSAAWTAGAMASTPGDLAHWVLDLFQGRILANSQLDSMVEFVDAGEVPLDYGLGVIAYDESVAGTQLIGHGGGIPGFLSAMYYLPEFDSAVVTIVNSAAGDPLAAMAELIEPIMNQ